MELLSTEDKDASSTKKYSNSSKESKTRIKVLMSLHF